MHTVSVIIVRAPYCRHLLSHTFLTKSVATSDSSMPRNPTSLHFNWKVWRRKSSLCSALSYNDHNYTGTHKKSAVLLSKPANNQSLVIDRSSVFWDNFKNTLRNWVEKPFQHFLVQTVPTTGDGCFEFCVSENVPPRYFASRCTKHSLWGWHRENRQPYETLWA